ncbi:MAG: hypothetical protein WCK55_11440 [Verrucomicrobiota bacterium]|jgi:hypothetical protein|nr:hypothetical protein LBMAG57_23240 [Verrucomicrobiota bacterium]
MKTVRVPWIHCRADEVDAVPTELEWRGRTFVLLAYSEKEARDWWRSLPDRDRENALGMAAEPAEDGLGLF